MKKILSIFILGVTLSLLSGCSEDYLEREPSQSVTDDALFSSVDGAQAALDGIHRLTYAYYGYHSAFGQKSIDMIIDIMGDDFFPTNDARYRHFYAWYQYTESRTATSDLLEYVWSYYYDIIDNANIIIEKVDGAEDAGTKEDKVKNIKGQAYAYRAYAYWYLVQLFAERYAPGTTNTQAGVPLVISSTAGAQPRSSVEEIYTQINSDIDQAIELLGESSTTRSTKSQINLNVAEGIKARIALTTGDYVTAATSAKAARQGYALTTNYKGGWNSASDSEWIWGAIIIDEQQTSYASYFSQIDPFFGGYASLGIQKSISTEVFNYLPESDYRKQLFEPEKYFSQEEYEDYFLGLERVGYKFSGYGEWTNDYLYMKSGEMYLIEAEALARQGGKDAEAQAVISELTKNRDPEAASTSLTGDALIAHILLERRAELWGDGFRLLDIKRLNTGLDRRNKGHNELIWLSASNFPAGSAQLLFLIPQAEIDANPAVTQNPLK